MMQEKITAVGVSEQRNDGTLHLHGLYTMGYGCKPMPRDVSTLNITLYCLNFLPISFLDSLRETDHPGGSGPFVDMSGECSMGGLPGPLPGGLPGFLLFTSGPA